MRNDRIIRKYARQLLDYDKESGRLFWKHDMGNGKIRAGTQAGYLRADGYREVRFNRTPAAEHRVAWFLTYGELPECQLDHINRNRADNRIVNLRVAPENAHHQNQNRRIGKNNTSGHIGVLWAPHMSKWVARIKVKGRSLYLGSFKDINDAIAARKAAEAEHFTFATG